MHIYVSILAWIGSLDIVPHLRFLSFRVLHDDVIKWKRFPRYWPFVRGIHREPVNSPHKSHSRGALMLSLICVWINGWVNNREAGDLTRYRAHYEVSVMDLSDAYCIPLRPLRWTFYSATTFTAQKSDPLLRKRFKILIWISNYIHYKMWDEINCPFPNFNSATSKFGNG